MKPLRVLVACEFSGTVRDILDGWQPVMFAAECDPEGGGWCKVRDCDPSSCPCLGPTQDGVEYKEVNGVLLGRHEERAHWDLMIAHPDCTYLTNSAEWAMKDADFSRYPGVGYHQKVGPGTLVGEARRAARENAIDFFLELWRAPITRVAIENPIGAISQMMKPSQIIHPHQFGDDASKGTCLWLRGLPCLQSTSNVPPRVVNGKKRWANQCDSGGQDKLPPTDDRWKLRAKTYQGIADAMADQWPGG